MIFILARFNVSDSCVYVLYNSTVIGRPIGLIFIIYRKVSNISRSRLGKDNCKTRRKHLCLGLDASYIRELTVLFYYCNPSV